MSTEMYRHREKKWEEAVRALRLNPRQDDEALLGALIELALAKHDARKLSAAIVTYREALDLAVETNRAADVAKVRRQLANCYQDAGHLDRAGSLYDQMRPSRTASPEERFKWLNARALLAERSSDAELANRLFRELVSLFRSQPRPYGRAIFALFNAGAWFAPRDPEFARHLLRRFAYWARKESLPEARYLVPALKGEIAKAQNRLAVAERCWAEAHAAAASVEPAAAPSVAVEWAGILRLQKRRMDAVAVLRGHIDGDELSSPAIAIRTELATTLLGEDEADPIRPAADELAEAEACLRRALSVEAMRGMPEIEWRILAALAGLAHHTDRLDAAILLGKCAVAGIQRMPRDGEESAGGGSAEARLYPYLKLIERLAEADRFAEASIIRSAMHRETVFQLRGRDRKADLREGSLPLQPRERRTLSMFEKQCDRLRDLRYAAEEPSISSAQSDAIRAVLRSKQDELSGWLDAVLAVRPRRSTSEIVAPEAITGRDAGFLHFARRSDRWAGVLHTAKGVQSFDIQDSHRGLARAIFDFRSAILDRSADWKRPAFTLYQKILGPVDLQLAGMSQLEIAPHGLFSFLPFAALYDGERCLVERLPVTVQTGIAVPPPKATNSPKILLVGSTDTRLPHVKAELDAIAGMSDRPSRPATFTAGALADGLAGKPNVVHVASHFGFDPVHPERSFIQLDARKRLSLAKFQSELFDLSGVDLLVLSACDTAMTERGIYGPESLAGLAQSKGASQVIGTLWPVHDMSSSVFMKQFYGGLLGERPALKAPRALQRAQCLMLAGAGWPRRAKLQVTGLGKPKDDWRHPYYWAGYALFVGTLDGTIAARRETDGSTDVEIRNAG